MLLDAFHPLQASSVLSTVMIFNLIFKLFFVNNKRYTPFQIKQSLKECTVLKWSVILDLYSNRMIDNTSTNVLCNLLSQKIAQHS